MEQQTKLAFAYLRVSGKGQVDGDGFPRQLAAIDSRNVPVVLIEKLDRLARDLMIQETILRDLQRRGVTLVSTMEPDLCSDDPSRKLVRQVMGAIAEYERVMIVAKLAGARQRMRTKNGSCEGRKPYGERKGERRTIDRILSLRSAGAAMDTIAETLNSEGLKPRSGQRWYGSSVRNVLVRAQAVTA